MTKRKRREFPKSVRVAAWNRCGGCCEGDNCGKKLFPGKFVYDHTVPDGLGGEPTLDNCKVLCSGESGSCDYKKTFGARGQRLDADVSKIAKADRIARKRNAPKTSKHSWPKRPMGNPRLKKRVDGTVVARDAL